MGVVLRRADGAVKAVGLGAGGVGDVERGGGGFGDGAEVCPRRVGEVVFELRQIGEAGVVAMVKVMTPAL